MKKCTVNLTCLYKSIKKRTRRLRYLYKLSNNEGPQNRGLLVGHVVLELDNLLVSGLRSFLISCLVGTKSRSKCYIHTSVNCATQGEALARSLAIISPTKYAKLHDPSEIALRDFPNVRDPKVIEKVFAAYDATNKSSLERALALNFSFYKDIAIFRNFYAHRSFDTFQKVKSKARTWGMVNVLHTNDIVLGKRHGRPTTIFEDWVAEASIFFEELTM